MVGIIVSIILLVVFIIGFGTFISKRKIPRNGSSEGIAFTFKIAK